MAKRAYGVTIGVALTGILMLIAGARNIVRAKEEINDVVSSFVWFWNTLRDPLNLCGYSVVLLLMIIYRKELKEWWDQKRGKPANTMGATLPDRLEQLANKLPSNRREFFDWQDRIVGDLSPLPDEDKNSVLQHLIDIEKKTRKQRTRVAVRTSHALKALAAKLRDSTGQLGSKSPAAFRDLKDREILRENENRPT